MAEYLYCGADLYRDEFPFACYRRVGHDGECRPTPDPDASERAVMTVADRSWVLTPETYRAIDQAVDDDGVFAKAYTRSVDGRLTTVGIRIGIKPHHVVAFFGDTVTRAAPGVYTVERGERRG